MLCSNEIPGAPKFRVYLRDKLAYSGQMQFFFADHPELTEADLFPTEGLEDSLGGETPEAHANGRWVFASGRPKKEWWVVPAEEDEEVYAFAFNGHGFEVSRIDEFFIRHSYGPGRVWWDRKLSRYVGLDGGRYVRLADYFTTYLSPKGLSYQPRLKVVPFETRFGRATATTEGRIECPKEPLEEEIDQDMPELV